MKKPKSKPAKRKYKSRGSNWNLRTYYLSFNKLWFGNRLPKDMPCEFADIEHLGNTAIHPQTCRPLYIQISNKLRFSARLTANTMLHEMVHVAHPEKRGHRAWFDKEMMKLAKRGAFNGWW